MTLFAIMWIQLEITILTEVSQTGKNKYHMIPLMCKIQKTVQMNLFTNSKVSDIKTNLKLLEEGEEG